MNAAVEIKTSAGGQVVSNPGILGGTPVFRGTRLPGLRVIFPLLPRRVQVLPLLRAKLG